MKKNSLKKLLRRASFAALALFLGFTQNSCLQEQAPGNRYTFTGETIAEFLEGREETFSDFIYCLKQANVWGEMKTYGEYTCFAPTNDAFVLMFQQEKYAKDGITSVEQLTKEQCDTIAFTHLCNNAFYCTDLIDGALPYPNMLDRYLVYTTDSAVNEEGMYEVIYRINKDSRIIARDDTLQNGVMQIVDRVVSPSNKFLPDEIKNDPNLTLFYRILNATGMEDSLTAYIDPTYPRLPVDSTDARYSKVIYDTGMETDQIGIFPAQRKFMFTVFAVCDYVFEVALGKNKEDITLEDLEAYAKSIYDEAFPEDMDQYDGPDNYKNRKSPLNRFISYHILPVQLSYNNLTVSQDELKSNMTGWDFLDIEEFYETMMPHSIMRLSNPKTGGIYINRKGTPKNGGVSHKGVRVWTPNESVSTQDALNGWYHYVDEPVVYSKVVREEVLNTRMRIMCQSLSPDFINSGARGRFYKSSADAYTYGFLDGFCKNIHLSDASQMWVRYRNHTFSCFLGEEISILGQYDVTVKLPPVPTSGTYEIRMDYCSMASSTADRGVVQVYLREGEFGADEPCDIPINLVIPSTDPRVGGIPDSELEAAGGKDAIIANDKAMHNRGWMKGPASYSSNGTALRAQEDFVRKILSTRFMYSNQDYYLRIRLVDDLGKEFPVCPFNCIEIVPKSVYAGEIIPEDTY